MYPAARVWYIYHKIPPQVFLEPILLVERLSTARKMETFAMTLFKIANRDLLPMLSVSFVFGTFGAIAILGLLALPAPPFSMAALLP
jgi:hypothetical protein